MTQSAKKYKYKTYNGCLLIVISVYSGMQYSVYALRYCKVRIVQTIEMSLLLKNFHLP